MARFDWIAFFKQRHIPYVTSGPNYSKKSVANIRCVFCGDADPSEHMGVSARGYWGCLRNRAHRGRDPVILIQKLVGCSLEEARRLVGVNATVAPTEEALAQSFKALRGSLGQKNASSISLRLPKEFLPLGVGALSKPFEDYLLGRGYRAAQIAWLTKHYRLHYATRGRYAYRIILPIEDHYGRLLSWTARTIVAGEETRYKTLRVGGDEDDWGPVALLPANHTVLGLPLLYEVSNPRVLVLVEGPFDALKLTAYGHSMGLYATSLFGLNVYPEQVSVLWEVSRRFEQVYLLLDADAELQRLRLLRALAGCGVRALRLPKGLKDPGEFSAQQVVEFCLNLGL